MNSWYNKCFKWYVLTFYTFGYLAFQEGHALHCPLQGQLSLLRSCVNTGLAAWPKPLPHNFPSDWCTKMPLGAGSSLLQGTVTALRTSSLSRWREGKDEMGLSRAFAPVQSFIHSPQETSCTTVIYLLLPFPPFLQPPPTTAKKTIRNVLSLSHP